MRLHRVAIVGLAGALTLGCRDAATPLGDSAGLEPSLTLVSGEYFVALNLAPEALGGAAFDINDQGDVVGSLQKSAELGGTYTAFLWQDGQLTELPGLGGQLAQATAINQTGMISGTATGLSGGMQVVLWRGGEATVLPTLGWPVAWTEGCLTESELCGTLERPGESRAVVWTDLQGDPQATLLGTLGGQHSNAVAMSESGCVVGGSLTAGGERHAYRWCGDGMSDLGTLGGDYSDALDVNERGDVVGASTTADGIGHAFLWRGGQLLDIHPPGATGSSVGYEVNDKGDVLVQYQETDGSAPRAAVFMDGHFVMVDVAQAYPVTINDRGQVAVEGYDEADLGGESQRPMLVDGGVVYDVGTGTASRGQPEAMNSLGQMVGIGRPVGTSADFPYLWRRIQPAAIIGAIEDQLTALCEGTQLTTGQCRSLGAKLRVASALIGDGKPIPASHQVGAFINQLEGLIGAGQVSAEIVQPLLMAASQAVSELGT